jgi:Holliday junction resolvase-like predicted endonuclease
MELQDPYLLLLKYRRLLLSEYSNLTGISEEILLEKLREINRYISLHDREVVLENPLEYALYLVKKGFSFKEVTRFIDWRDFEKFTAEILSSHKYMVLTNFRSTKPVRFEIDVIGVDIGSGRSIFVDCKHWSKGIARSSLIEVMEKHRERILKFIKYYSWFRDKWVYFKKIKYIIPVIVTLTTPIVRVLDNVVAVSIQEFNQFLADIHVVLDTLNIQPFTLKTS